MSSSTTFFFFQAEGGIRAYMVTGVQTCALPIYAVGIEFARAAISISILRNLIVEELEKIHALCAARSEERRVGKSVDRGGCRVIIREEENYRQDQRSS